MTSTKTRARQFTLGMIAVCLLAGMATAQSLTTTFASNNGQTGNMFDVKALNTLQIDRFDINFDNTATIEVWAVTGGGTYLGNQTSNANWTLIQTVPNLTSNGANIATPLPPLTTPFLMTAGSIQGFHVTTVNGSINYTNGTAQGALYVSNSDMEIYEGHGGSYFNLINVPRVWNGTIYYTLVGQMDDLMVTGFSAPTGDAPGCELLSMTETVTVDMRNIGMNPILAGTLIQVDLTVDGGPIITEFATTPATLNLGDTFSHTFSGTFDLSAVGPHTLSVTAYYAGDLDPSNDTATATFQSGGATRISTYPYIENFDSVTTDNTTNPPAGWTQDGADATGTYSDWYFRTTITPSPNTGPTADHTTGTVGVGYYAHVEDAGNFGQVNLISPCFDLGGLISPAVNFWLHSNNNTSPPTTSENFISLDVITYPGGIITVDVDGPVGHQGAAWTPRAVDLSAFAGQVVQLVFRGQSSGGGFNHDIAIDDVSVYDPQPTPGQAPQPGLATLDINGALNVNTAPVGLGFGGPYFGSVDVGAVMTIRIGGEVNTPIAFLAGPLTPVAATYPNIGQLDIGGIVNPMTGVPSNIVVIGDGFNPFTFIDAIFNTGPAGQLNLGFQIPPLPSGVLAGFQSLLGTTNGFFFAISNAVEVTIN